MELIEYHEYKSQSVKARYPRFENKQQIIDHICKTMYTHVITRNPHAFRKTTHHFNFFLNHTPANKQMVEEITMKDICAQYERKYDRNYIVKHFTNRCQLYEIYDYINWFGGPLILPIIMITTCLLGNTYLYLRYKNPFMNTKYWLCKLSFDFETKTPMP
jgi:hypothetical protein